MNTLLRSKNSRFSWQTTTNRIEKENFDKKVKNWKRSMVSKLYFWGATSSYFTSTQLSFHLQNLVQFWIYHMKLIIPSPPRILDLVSFWFWEPLWVKPKILQFRVRFIISQFYSHHIYEFFTQIYKICLKFMWISIFDEFVSPWAGTQTQNAEQCRATNQTTTKMKEKNKTQWKMPTKQHYLLMFKHSMWVEYVLEW